MMPTLLGWVTPSRSTTLPPVGPAALVRRSNSRLVKYIRQASVAVVADLAGIEQIVAGRKDDVADFDGEDFILLVELDRAGGQNFSQALQVPFWK
jgi:hypothetical protein